MSGAASNSINRDLPYLKHLDNVKFRPIFIIGPHRSGTTILYRILLESGCFNGVNAFSIVNQHRLLQLHFEGKEQEAREELTREFEARGLKDRDFDAMKISCDMPEEYCFAFKNQGKRPILDRDNLESFNLFCRKLQVVQDPNRPLLLKNPFDTVNFMQIRELLPDAKFVFIYRDPAEIINSQVKGLQSIFEKKNEYVAMVWRRYRELYENPLKLAAARAIYCGPIPFLYWQVSRNISRNCDYVEQNVPKLGNAAYGVSYPQLCQSPNETIHGILDYLSVKEPSPVDYSQYIQPRKFKPIPEVERGRQWISDRNRAYRERFGV